MPLSVGVCRVLSNDKKMRGGFSVLFQGEKTNNKHNSNLQNLVLLKPDVSCGSSTQSSHQRAEVGAAQAQQGRAQIWV